MTFKLLFVIIIISCQLWLWCVHGSAIIERRQSGDIISGLPCQSFQEKISESTCKCIASKPTVLSKKNQLLNCRGDQENLKISGCKSFITVVGNSFHFSPHICSNDEEKHFSSKRIDVWDYTSENDWVLFYKSTAKDVITFESNSYIQLSNRRGWDGLLIRLFLTCDECLLIKFTGHRKYPLERNFTEIVKGMTIRIEDVESEDSPMNPGILVPIIVIIPLLIIAITLAIYCYCRKKHKKRFRDMSLRDVIYTVNPMPDKRDENENVALVDIVELIEETANHSALTVDIPTAVKVSNTIEENADTKQQKLKYKKLPMIPPSSKNLQRVDLNRKRESESIDYTLTGDDYHDNNDTEPGDECEITTFRTDDVGKNESNPVTSEFQTDTNPDFDDGTDTTSVMTCPDSDISRQLYVNMTLDRNRKTNITFYNGRY